MPYRPIRIKLSESTLAADPLRSGGSQVQPASALFGLMLAVITVACSARQEPAAQRNNSSTPPQACLGDASQAAQPRRVAVVPQLPPSEIYSRWAPLLQDLGQRSKLCFELVVPPSIPALEQLLKTGGVDYAFMNPYHQVMVKDTYQPLIRDDQHQLKGVLVIHRKSTLKTLDDLKGQTVAFPAPNAFAASLLIRADLRQRGIPIEADYVTSHSNVYRSVALKLSSAGGGVNNTLNREEPEIARHLKILHTTRGYAAHPFSALRSLPASETTTLAEAWLALGNQSQQHPLLNRVQIPRPVRSDYQRDYGPLEQLGLETLVQRSAP